MPNRQKSRTHKTSPNTAGTKRREDQKERMIENNYALRTPWQKAKAKRRAIRIQQGKHIAWEKKYQQKLAYDASKLARTK